MIGKIAAIAAAVVLCACAGPGPAVDTACVWVTPILVSGADRLTTGTAVQILRHNATWKANCPNERAAR